MKTVRFYYVRHGQTLFNEIGKMQGWCDSPLTQKGIEDAHRAREALKDINFNRAYSSSSERCIDTAKIILKGRDCKLTSLKGLKEFNFGRFEGATISNHQQEIDKRRFNTYDWKDVGGEDLEMLKHRVLKTYERIFNECDKNDNVLIVSHGAVFLHMLGFMFDLDKNYYLEQIKKGPEEDMPIPNGFAAIFNRSDYVYDLDKLIKRDDSLLSDLKQLRIYTF